MWKYFSHHHLRTNSRFLTLFEILSLSLEIFLQEKYWIFQEQHRHWIESKNLFILFFRCFSKNSIPICSMLNSTLSIERNIRIKILLSKKDARVWNSNKKFGTHWRTLSIKKITAYRLTGVTFLRDLSS